MSSPMPTAAGVRPGVDEATTRRLVARHILQRLGEGGQPPEYDVSRINVGNESYLKVLDYEYFQTLLRIGASFKLVQGYFGGGKTHFLYCVRELAWKHGFCVAVVELSPAECPYDDSFKVYRAVASRLSLRPTNPLVPPETGIGDVVRSRVESELAGALESLGAAADPEAESRARAEVAGWLEHTVGRAPCESHSFRQAIVGLGLAWLRGDTLTERRLEAWLSGEQVPPGELRDAGVYEQLGKANGFTMLRCISQMAVALGLAGTALLFDEVDRNLSVSAKRSHAIGDNLRQVIDLCGRHQLPNTLFVYAVPPEFLRNVVPDYPALQQRLKSPMPMSVRSPQAVLIDLEKLDIDAVDLLDRIGQKVLDVFVEARECPMDVPLQHRNARQLAQVCVDAMFEVNHRRLFVKTWVDFLHGQMIDGESALTEADARRLVAGGQEAVKAVSPADGFDDF